MPHFAELNENNEVINVFRLDDDQIIDENGNESEQKGIDHLHFYHGTDRRWVRTSYRGNFRGRYAGIGYTYREDLDMFIEPQPFSSWTLNETTGEWEPPISKPEAPDQLHYYQWDENQYQTTNNGWILKEH